MFNILINWLIMALAVIASAYVLPGVTVASFVAALVVALVLGILNALIKPLLIILTLPISILTLGLFTFVINAFLVWVAAAIVNGFQVRSFWWALIFGIVLAIFQFLINSILGRK